MTRDNIQRRVKQVVMKALGLDPSKQLAEGSLSELGADSLDKIEILMEIEEIFDIRVSDGSAKDIRTVEDLVDYVKVCLYV